MLLFRSIPTLHLYVLLLIITLARSQYYDDDSREDNSNYREEADDRPDYTKYFKQDASASILSPAAAEKADGGFVTPLDFSGFLNNLQLSTAASTQQALPVIAVQSPFRLQNGEKKQQITGFVNPKDFQTEFSGAHLELQPPSFANEPKNLDKLFDKSTFDAKPANKPLSSSGSVSNSGSNKYKKPKISSSEAEDLNDYKKPETKPTYELPKSEFTQPAYDFNNYQSPAAAAVAASITGNLDPAKNLYVSPSLTAAKSHTAPQVFPPAQQVQQRYTKLPQVTNGGNAPLLPYQKYGFQAVAPAPSEAAVSYTAQPTEYKAQAVKNSNCRQVAKQVSPEDISHGRFRRAADRMQCYVCTDPKTGGNYEQCSYTSEPTSDGSYFRGHAEKYSTKTYGETRRRRSIDEPLRKSRENKKEEQEQEEEQHYVNPFEDEKKNSHTFSSKPDEFDGDYYKVPDFSNYESEKESRYGLDPEYFSSTTNEEKSYSELQSEELLKDSANCKEVKRDALTCKVCANPKTGGNYEQCSYTSEPKEKKYAYVKEKKYNSNEPTVIKETSSGTEPRPAVQPKRQRKQPEQIEPQRSASDKHYYDHPHFLENKKKADISASTSSNRDKEDIDEYSSKDYVVKLFPDYAETREDKQQYPSYVSPEDFTSEDSKKDVATVLEEFAAKDRSNCKKVAKNKMTCFLCVDAKGIQNEECMFVSASEPKSSHIAYHELKAFSTDPKRQEAHPEAEEKEAYASHTAPELAKPEREQLSQKAFSNTPVAFKDVDAEPTEYVKTVNGKTPRIVRRRTNISKEYLIQQPLLQHKEQTASIEPQGSTKEEKRVKRDSANFETGSKNNEAHVEAEGSEGAYASELVPTYSKKLGVSLPAYMLDISEGERVFDEVVKSGRR